MNFQVALNGGTMWIARSEVDRVVRNGVPFFWGGKLDLYHAGAQTPEEREERLERFLDRQPGWEEREARQRHRHILARMLALNPPIA